jgi:hypothetical protein
MRMRGDEARCAEAPDRSRTAIVKSARFLGTRPQSLRNERLLDAAEYLAAHIHEAPLWIIPCLEGATPTRTSGSSHLPSRSEHPIGGESPRSRRDIDEASLAVREEGRGRIWLAAQCAFLCSVPIGYLMGRFTVFRSPMSFSRIGGLALPGLGIRYVHAISKIAAAWVTRFRRSWPQENSTEVQRFADWSEANLRIAAGRGRVAHIRIKASDFAPLGVDPLDHCGGNRTGVSVTAQFRWGVYRSNTG